jgi:hypothetical protein
MKYQSFILAGILLLSACNQSAKTEENNTTQKEEQAADQVATNNTRPVSNTANNANRETAAIKFEELEYDFGTIKEGVKAKHTFKFKNTGTVPLIIQNASASCGCTVPDWPKQPIPVGETGEIKVEFDSSGKSGTIAKTVTIVANTEPAQSELKITGVVNAVSTMNGPLKQ